MFAWALKEKRKKWGIDANPFTGFGQAEKESSSRRPFTPDELRMLLSHKDYQKRHFRSRHAFWLIPLGAFTGARLGELCQLDLKDFVEVEGIPCLDINDTEATEEQVVDGRRKHVKNANAKRLVPIHPELIRMGLLEYVAELRAAGQSPHLFPGLSRKHRDGPAHPASKWFADFRHAAGLTEKQATVFHSLRHLFITTILDAGTAPHMLAPIVGHEAKLVTDKVYWNTRDATKRLPTVEAFTLPDDIISMFPRYNAVTFTKQRGTRPSERT
jgi:integrase